MGLYILASYQAANLITRLALIFLTIALYVGWYAYCTASWGRVFPTADSDYFVGYGVWRIGDNQFQSDDPPASSGNHAPVPSISHTDGWLLEWYGAFQTFATFGFVSVNLGYFLIVLFVYVGPCKTNGDLAFWNAVNNIVGSACWLIAIILFGVEFDDTYDIYSFDDPTLHYSFFLAIITCLLQMVAGVLLLFAKRGGPAVHQTA